MEYFAFTTPKGTVIRLPFPLDLALEKREAYMAAQIAAHSDTDED
jgi:hypothetical protein